MSQPGPPRKPLKNGWAKFVAGFGYAFNGLWYALRTQVNMRVHLAIAVLTILLGILLHISTAEFAIIFVMIAIVFIAEMVNTVFELTIDLFSPEYHPLAKTAKDLAAGAVLLSAIFAIIVGLLIFGPRLWALIR